jgi:hypothetical protein
MDLSGAVAAADVPLQETGYNDDRKAGQTAGLADVFVPAKGLDVALNAENGGAIIGTKVTDPRKVIQ